MASRLDAGLVIALAASVMALGAVTFLLVGSSVPLYGVACAELGLRAGAPQRASTGGQRLWGDGTLAHPADCGPLAPSGDPRLPAGCWLDLIASLDYLALLAVLVFFAVAEAIIEWWRY